MASPMRSSGLSPFDSPSGTARQSPFRRQNSVSPATTVRTSTPTASPTKASSSFSPVKAAQLSPEKTSPFVRRPSQLGNNAIDRPSSPFARPASSLSISSTPAREPRETSPERQMHEEITPQSSPTRQIAAEKFARLDNGDSPASSILPNQTSLRPTVQRTTTASSTATIKPAHIATPPTRPTNLAGLSNRAATSASAYTHLPQPLLHSMRESFEVLDAQNTSSISSAAVADMLTQLGLDATPAALSAFFPPSQPCTLNLSRYLDVLSGPLAHLSPPEELRAAFEAFDVDDSGQIDVGTLREALLRSSDEDLGRLSEREIDGVLAEFSGRRAFGAKGLHAAKGKGEVFRYRDFMANVSAGGAVPPEGQVPVAA